MFNPVSTYRLQFHSEFTFSDFEKIIDYLQKLGVGTIYASPIFESTPGSTHGYDGVNPQKLNPEIGTWKQLKDISAKLKSHGIGWLQDIVPNHMAFHPNNVWLMDVLEKGSLSEYKSFFDFTDDRIMVPFLGASLEEVIENRGLKITLQNQGLCFSYYDSHYPLHLRSYPQILSEKKNPNQAIEQLLQQVQQILDTEEPKAYSIALTEFKTQLASLAKQPEEKEFIEKCLEKVNKSQKALSQIASQQAYRLCHWQETDKEINFRRFFTVNGLISLNIQKKKVFDAVHKLILKLYNEGIFNGLRIDHIDGLYDPTSYLEQLRAETGEEAYIVVEKILEPGEPLPAKWPIQGETGYNFLGILNNLFTNPAAKNRLNGFYQKFVGKSLPVHDQILHKKSYILTHHMAGDLENLFRYFISLELANREEVEMLPADSLKQAIGQFLIHCPVYRYYGNQFPLDKEEAEAVKKIFKNVVKANKELEPAINLLWKTFLGKAHSEEYSENATAFYQKLMQFTGPLMAKGVEDTLMYTYNAFSSHNEVGDAPDAFGISIEDFHKQMQIRHAQWPLSINGSSTHDTKRGEDVRARLNVLSDIAGDWIEAIPNWQRLNSDLKSNGAPDVNDEYFIYQTLLGAYPMPGEDEDNFSERICQYLEKALREAKQNSNWTEPNTAYEEATKNFTLGLLDKHRSFWKQFEKFHAQAADLGIVNSLSQVLLKFTCPGVPDVYQGCELWDLSLVDPDNRRAVDYEKRSKWLQELEKAEKENLLPELWQTRYSGKIKLWLTHALLNLCKECPELFSQGEYLPLKVEGRYRKHVLTFARRYQNDWLITAVPLHVAEICKYQKKETVAIDWQDTRIILPPGAPSNWESVLNGSIGKQQKGIAVSDILKDIPLGLIKLNKPETKRGAGILMHITSLPSAFGVGDLGPEAYKFADFLSRSSQKYWQLLPLSPTAAGNGHSPYSAYSSMAGNPLLISVELLQKEGLLDDRDLKSYRLQPKSTADYKSAEQSKDVMFQMAWKNFKENGSESQRNGFKEFCKREASWLDDFALYVVLKLQQDGNPWHTWPEKFRLRDKKALADLAKQSSDDLEKAKWLQFIFIRQWKSLREYCNKLAVKLFGDLPFYVSYDSVDVWANPEIFSLDEKGEMNGMAGVPPDYFNEDGQLWGMPVFCWDKLKEQGYRWWIDRIKKNVESYDLIRLDHFRAFSSYWEVPAGEKTAKNGEWLPGPGADFFKAVQNEIGNLPFVAEDLGDIEKNVYKLRDEFNLPGMKILQFAWGDAVAESDFSPHNYTRNFVAYTGTHDNNTTRGWFRQEANKDIREQIEDYTGLSITEKNIHEILGRMVYSSIAETAILPIQDVIGLDESARMNTPASVDANWLWRLKPGQLNEKVEDRLRTWAKIFNRA
ncbi:MAG: hypothetical protein K0S09_104 [Sphingobacteriaceae bacterium]|jgi:malto-oligosyltrehalose synthase/4-alpha-glucanotransferase|nr:hypothetical protein [Sphingobacteriaceae bacterium]